MTSLTPDKRYSVVRGPLWRAANPHLSPQARTGAVKALMAARRAAQTALKAEDASALHHARQAVDAAKRALGERGPPWWTDGAPDLNRRMAPNTPYADWWSGICQATAEHQTRHLDARAGSADAS